ncbi:MAG: aldo/keto reductase [Anaerovoracaceae bacterium]|jgi:predicted aldo/keto reductase-like oxidoreductase
MLGKDIKKLGFGLMRLPKIGEKSDVDQVCKMVDMFLEAGFTYFDTARAYGDSEETIKKVLIDRYPRDSFQLATKNAAWLGAKNEKEAKEMFQTSLDNTGAGYFDFYLAHNLGNERTAVFDNYDMWDFFKGLKKDGLIKHLGFSYHDKADNLKKILADHPEMEFVQLQINYADWNSDIIESRKCYEVVREHGLPVTIMETVKGGLLINVPDEVKEIFGAVHPDWSMAEWAIKFAASLDGIITVLSGMSSIEQMSENLKFMKGFEKLNEKEMAAIAEARKVIEALPQIPCTSCRYCTKECPQNIRIPDIFKAMNFEIMYHDRNFAKNEYGFATLNAGKASDCIKCGQCEQACTQHIEIIKELENVAATLE